MKKIKGESKRINIIFTEEIIQGFDELIEETGATFSELIRRAASLYLDKYKNKEEKNGK